jgi:hypothetical protein
MADEIRRTSIGDAEEAWERVTDDPDLKGIDARQGSGESWWLVFVAVAEFLREEPLEGELRRRMAAALEAVPGVQSVDEEDREAWLVTGAPSGKALVEAAAAVVDDIAPRARAHLDSL